MFNVLVRWLTNQSAVLFSAIDSRVPEVPSQLTGACVSISSAMAQFRGMGYFIPWEACGVAVGILLAGLTAGLVIKVVRIGASFVTLGGGAA